MRARFALVLVLGALLLVGCSDPGGALTLTPRLDTLPVGVWTRLPFGGDTGCADGSRYAAQVRRGDGDTLVLAFQGGGATWGPIPDASPLLGSIALYTRRVTDVARTGLAAPPPDDPLANATQVVVSYCTGDVHWGDADGIDTRGADVAHRGAENVRAVLAWLDDQALAPEELAIVGCSAGAYGALLWAPTVQELYPAARRSLLLDAGLGVIQAPFVERPVGLASWNVAGAFTQNGVAELLDTLDVDYYERLVAEVVRVFEGPIGIASTDRDLIQAVFWHLMGEDPSGFPDVGAWSEEALVRVDALVASGRVGTFLSDWVPSMAPSPGFGASTGHCLSDDDDLWSEGVGEAFRAWWGALRDGDVPPAVDARAAAPGDD
jgi:hypothetical protein